MGFLNGKKILITGVLSNHSIAYGIAQVCHREGAELAFSYAGDHARDRIGKFAEEFGSDFILPLDVTKNEHIEGAVKTIQESGVVLTASFIRSATLPAKRSPVTSWKASPVKRSSPPWISPQVPTRSSPRPSFR